MPVDATTLTFLATGPIAGEIAGARVHVIPIAANSFAVDVSRYSGAVVDIRFVNTSTALFDPVALDKIEFTSAPVPEPGTALLFSLGAVLTAFRRNRRGPCSDARPPAQAQPLRHALQARSAPAAPSSRSRHTARGV